MISELLRMFVEAGQRRASTLSDVILKHFEHVRWYTPRRAAFTHLVGLNM
jgi:hypothetical protein